MKANASIVALGIAKSDCHSAVKDCLRALFNFELENANTKNPQYKERYREIIDSNLAKWSENEGSN